jgi:hypothetical protein
MVLKWMCQYGFYLSSTLHWCVKLCHILFTFIISYLLIAPLALPLCAMSSLSPANGLLLPLCPPGTGGLYGVSPTLTYASFFYIYFSLHGLYCTLLVPWLVLTVYGSWKQFLEMDVIVGDRGTCLIQVVRCGARCHRLVPSTVSLLVILNCPIGWVDFFTFLYFECKYP